MNYDLINKLSDIEESLSLAGFLFKKNNDYVTFYKIEFSGKRAPEIPECIKIDKKLHVKKNKWKNKCCCFPNAIQ